MTTADTLARFTAEYLVPRSITPKRQGEQLRELQRLAAWLDPKPLTDLTQPDVLTYLGEKLTRGLHPNSARAYHIMIRSFVSWAAAAGLIEPERERMLRLIAAPRGSTPRGKPSPYTRAEVRQFRTMLAEKYPLLPEYGRGSRLLPRYLQGKSDAMRGGLFRHARRLQFEAQVALALELGLRSKEIHGLTLAAAHYENDALVVMTAKQGPGVRTYRQIPWTPHAQARMTDWIDFRSLISPPNDSLWLTLSYGDQLSPQSMDTFHSSLRRAFGPGWRWHRFRHTAATEWLRAKMPVEKLRVLMGHADIQQTLEYTKIADSDISEAMQNAGESFARAMGVAA